MKLLRPTDSFKDEILEFKNEFFYCGEDVINGGELLDKMDSIEEWLEYV